jgi:hypothetical protein
MVLVKQCLAIMRKEWMVRAVRIFDRDMGLGLVF